LSISNPQVPVPEWQSALLERHGLGQEYLASAREWFIPVAQGIAAHQNSAKHPILIGVNGSQGSGKTTMADYLCCVLAAEFGLPTLSLSLDDVYLPRAERQRLAVDVHPLLVTRGVPGTHDVPLLLDTLKALLDSETAVGTALPSFDKSRDDRVPPGQWQQVETVPAIVLLEGWCLGAEAELAEALAEPVNALERDEDDDGRWRHYVNESLAREFPPVYALVDQWLMLQAPSFDCVLQWRREQEHKLADRRGGMTGQMMDDQALERFVAHFERLTRHCLDTLPPRVDYLLQLDDQRAVIEARIGAGGVA
jgi:D-glycerate 3-kinase